MEVGQRGESEEERKGRMKSLRGSYFHLWRLSEKRVEMIVGFCTLFCISTMLGTEKEICSV
jgi:hypothetical protein